MNWRQLLFAVIAIAAAGSALARPPAPTPKEDILRLQHLLARKAYVVNRVEWVGDALTIIHFSSLSCRDMKVMPVSVILQESALLRDIGGDKRYFVYRDRVWRTAEEPPVALVHIAQQFREIARVTAAPALDTMLYFVVPKQCRTPVDWGEFWQSGEI